MLPRTDINEIVRGAAMAAFRKVRPSRVMSEATVASDGEAALHVTIVLPPENSTSLDGDMIVDAIAGIQRRLIDAGEERFAIVDFVTEEDLRQDGDR